MILEPRATRHKRAGPSQSTIIVLILLIAVLAGAWVYYTYYMPNWRMAPIPGRDDARLVIGGVAVDAHPIVADDSILLPIETIRQYFDPTIFWDQQAQSIIVTTRDRLIKMQTESLTAFVNRVPRNLNMPATVKDDVVYVPMDVLEPLYQVKGRFVEASGTVLFDFVTKPYKTASVVSDQTPLRTGPSKHEPIVAKMPTGEKLVIVDGTEGWYMATTESGYFGYVPDKALALGPVAQPEQQDTPAPKPWKPEGKINLTWEHVLTKNPVTSTIGDMPGANVVSPTWFGLVDETGNLKNKADAGYVRWAHSKGYKVWALVDNGFDPKRTTEVLRSLEKREAVVQQLLAYASLYQIDGINIDFENVYYEDSALFTQFVRELTPLAREQGLTVSIDVTVKSSSPTWSMFYDRKALAQTVDYVMLMAYDEYPANSQVAGSVSSLPWVEEGILGLLQDMPASKLVLGVPFYTRIWREETVSGKFTVTSKAVGMLQAEDTLRRNQAVVQYDPQTQQNFGVYREAGAQCKVWLEDEQSMAARVQLVQKYSLAGIASWRRGFDKPAVWNVITNGLR